MEHSTAQHNFTLSTMISLTVGYVAGIIAFAVVLLELLLPNLVGILLASSLNQSRSAATWSVAGRDLQNTAWPIILRTDTTASRHAALPVRALSWVRSVGIVLIAVSGITAPLGLYTEIRLQDSSTPVPFSYVADTGPMGYGTPHRDPDSFFNRVCYNHLVYGSCPFSTTTVNITRNSTIINAHWDDKFWKGTYDNRLPHLTAEIFNSVHNDWNHTVAGSFDIEWRSWGYSMPSPPEQSVYGDKRYPIGSMRFLDSLILHDEIEALEGLIVDMRSGGIGFRNHTAPVHVENGAEWSEDLLFVNPETACVDTNLTLDYQIAPSGANVISTPIVNVSITDRGGFVNIDRNYTGLAYTFPDPPRDAELHFRAQLGAWLNNGYSMLYLNITNPHSDKYKHALQYVNSEMGKKYWLDGDDPHIGGDISYDRLRLLPTYGAFLPSDVMYGYNISVNYTDRRAKYPNPFNIDYHDFESAQIMCAGNGNGDMANISNIAVACGLMYGAAVPVDSEAASLVFEPWSWWRQPIYSCATASKASLKTVRFRWNATLGPEAGLKRLQVLEMKDKTYQAQSDEPYWAVENLHRQLRYMYPLWGMTSTEMAVRLKGNEHIDIIQSPHLYLPGLAGQSYALSQGYASSDNLPAGTVFPQLVSSAYTIGDGLELGSVYSGATSMALFSKWQALSRSPETAALIPNLVWTDYAANALIGTRSTLSDNRLPNNIQPPLHETLETRSDDGLTGRRTTPERSPAIPVSLYRSGVSYHWQFAIPGIVTMALLCLLLVISTGLLLAGRLAGLQAVKQLLYMTSSGRLLAYMTAEAGRDGGMELDARQQTAGKSSDMEQSRAARGRHHLFAETKQWLREVGPTPIALNHLESSRILSTCKEKEGSQVSQAEEGLTLQPAHNGYVAVPQHQEEIRHQPGQTYDSWPAQHMHGGYSVAPQGPGAERFGPLDYRNPRLAPGMHGGYASVPQTHHGQGPW